MASSEDEDRPAPTAGRKHDRQAPDPLEALDLQTPEGPLPGIPLGSRNGKAPHALSDVGAQTQGAPSSGVCVPCLIARGVMILVLTGALIALVVIERRKAQAKPASA